MLFNHEGTRRGEEFVTRKVTKGVAKIVKSLIEGKPFESIELGNVDTKRDWSDAEDFVDGIWKMLNQETPKEYVLSSNETHTIKEFVWYAFKAAGIEGAWHGNGTGAEFSISTTDYEKYQPTSIVTGKQIGRAHV